MSLFLPSPHSPRPPCNSPSKSSSADLSGAGIDVSGSAETKQTQQIFPEKIKKDKKPKEINQCMDILSLCFGMVEWDTWILDVLCTKLQEKGSVVVNNVSSFTSSFD